MAPLGLILWERRHAVRPELPGRTLCGIRTGITDVSHVPGLLAFAGQGEEGFPACARCLPMWRRVVELAKDKVSACEIAVDTSTYRNVRYVLGVRAAA